MRCVLTGALLTVGIASATNAAVIFDQIDVFSETGTGFASQFFEPANAAFNIGAIDDFSVTGGNGSLTGVDAVVVGFGGFTSLANVTSWTVQIYSSTAAAAGNLIGDVASVGGLTAVSAAYGTGPNRFLISLNLIGSGVNLANGNYWIAVIPNMPFGGGGGQLGQVVSATNAGPGPALNGVQANPGGGFGFVGGLSASNNNFALRISAVPAPGAIALLGLAGLVSRRRR